MSVSVNQILSDARRLVSRLRDHDTSTDTIIHKAHILYKNVQEMKEYNEEVTEQNLANQMRSAPPENKHIRELQLENRELRELLEEHQSVLELIMSKYRQQATRLVCDSFTTPPTTPHSTQELQRLADDICRLAGVMQHSVELDDACHSGRQERLTELLTENRGLRELLHISRAFGSLQPPLSAPHTQDKHVQTDNT